MTLLEALMLSPRHEAIARIDDSRHLKISQIPLAGSVVSGENRYTAEMENKDGSLPRESYCGSFEGIRQWFCFIGISVNIDLVCWESVQGYPILQSTWRN